MIYQHPKVSVFTANNTDEVFFALCSQPHRDFRAELIEFMERYESFLAQYRCSQASEVFVRFHLSDVTTQFPVLREVVGNRCSFFSYVGQSPVHGSRIAMEAYHIRMPDKLDKKIIDEDGAHELDVVLKNYELFFHCRRQLRSGDSYTQTQEECQTLNRALEKRGGTLKENCLRTWFYGRDIDNSYTGIVDARREFFHTLGMNRNSHYIASTGIEGQSSDPHRLVRVDSLCMFGIQKEQKEFMHAPDHMPPTDLYNVTFERGTRMVYGDRSHYYISGTASIDAQGNVMHPGNVRDQTRRMVENVRALLENHDSRLDDLKIASVYLRDYADANIVAEEIHALFPPALPRIIVSAPVCRPGWLIEMEGIAVNSKGNETYKPFA